MDQKLCITAPEFPQLAYLKTGTGPALILLHGFPESGDLWRKVWPSLSKNFTVIVPDLPGTGGSTFKGEQVSIEQLAESVKLIMDGEGIGQAVIAGHSMGGYVALAFAEMHSDKLAGLSLIHSTASADSDEKKQTRRKSIELINKGGKEAFIRQMIPALFADKFKENKAALEREIEKGLKLDAKSMVAFYNAMINRPERSATLNGVAYPVQWIFGKEDTVIPHRKAMQQSTLANVNFVSVYPGAGHMSMLEVPETLTKDLDEFGRYCFKLTR